MNLKVEYLKTIISELQGLLLRHQTCSLMLYDYYYFFVNLCVFIMESNVGLPLSDFVKKMCGLT